MKSRISYYTYIMCIYFPITITKASFDMLMSFSNTGSYFFFWLIVGFNFKNLHDLIKVSVFQGVWIPEFSKASNGKAKIISIGGHFCKSFNKVKLKARITIYVSEQCPVKSKEQHLRAVTGRGKWAGKTKFEKTWASPTLLQGTVSYHQDSCWNYILLGTSCNGLKLLPFTWGFVFPDPCIQPMPSLTICPTK